MIEKVGGVQSKKTDIERNVESAKSTLTPLSHPFSCAIGDSSTMNLLPREELRLLLHSAGSLAQKRLARGVKLNLVEATALIASVLQELIRDGQHSVAQLQDLGKRLLGRRQVLPSVPSQLHEIQVEGCFQDGVFLVTVHEPVSSRDGDLSLALYGSFLPLPALEAFGGLDEEIPEDIHGQLIVCKEVSPVIQLNRGRERARVKVTNMGDRAIQVSCSARSILISLSASAT